MRAGHMFLELCIRKVGPALPACSLKDCVDIWNRLSRDFLAGEPLKDGSYLATHCRRLAIWVRPAVSGDTEHCKLPVGRRFLFDRIRADKHSIPGVTLEDLVVRLFKNRDPSPKECADHTERRF